MMNLTVEGTVLEKTQELCQALVDHPEFAALREKLEAFMADEPAQTLFRELNELGSELQYKQQQGQNLAETEIADFEKRREALLNQPVARDFFSAQQSIRDARDTINRYVARTFELGRKPEPEDLHACGSGCNCSHS
jgi:cell fate (sporulation/competence/biofilm development) regulator YlbF (YheA/YmcA/DUF963 family)